MPPKTRAKPKTKTKTTKPKPKPKPKPKSKSRAKPLKDHTLTELHAIAKKLRVPYSAKRKADLIKDIQKEKRSPKYSVPKVLTPKRNQVFKVNKIPLTVHSKSVVYDNVKGATIKECHNNVCKVTHIPSKYKKRVEPEYEEETKNESSQIRIQDERLYLPEVLSFYPEIKK
jgi:hypothetical protein